MFILEIFEFIVCRDLDEFEFEGFLKRVYGGVELLYLFG